MADECYKTYQKNVAAGINLYMERDMCYIDVAEELKDYQVCNRIKDSGIKDQCLYTIAEIIMDISICDKMTSRKNVCYFKVAMETKDLSICQKMNHEDDRSPNDCYYHISKINKNALICDKIINDDRLKKHCIQNAQIK